MKTVLLVDDDPIFNFLHTKQLQNLGMNHEVYIASNGQQALNIFLEVLAGSTMPNLMYRTTFENQAARDAHWKAFGQDPQWKKLSSMPEYQHNVSKNVTRFFRPTSYSDI